MWSSFHREMEKSSSKAGLFGIPLRSREYKIEGNDHSNLPVKSATEATTPSDFFLFFKKVLQGSLEMQLSFLHKDLFSGASSIWQKEKRFSLWCWFDLVYHSKGEQWCHLSSLAEVGIVRVGGPDWSFRCSLPITLIKLVVSWKACKLLLRVKLDLIWLAASEVAERLKSADFDSLPGKEQWHSLLTGWI